MIKNIIEKEQQYQENTINLIASDNYASKDVLMACGSCLQNIYSEGKPNIEPVEQSNEPYFWYKETGYQRYYAGCENVDKIEIEAIKGVCKAFNTRYANVQCHSGSTANLEVYSAICKYWSIKPDQLTIISHSLNSYSHLTHGAKPTISGQWFNAIQYEVNDDGLFNYDELEKQLLNNNEYRVFVVGFSAYPRQIDYAKIAKLFREKCDKETFIFFDTSHISGLIVAGLHQNPMDYDYGKAIPVLSTTTHKTLRMARHAVITTNNYKLAKCIDNAVFPFSQGGALQNMVAGVAVGFAEALTPEFKKYQEQVLKNVQAMVEVFNECGIKLITGGSDNHLILIDLREENFSGKDLETVLEKQGIITNKNAVVGDIRPKSETSGLRIGTPAITTRGATEQDAHEIALYISANIDYLRNHGGVPDAMYESGRKFVKDWCKNHPIYKK